MVGFSLISRRHSTTSAYEENNSELEVQEVAIQKIEAPIPISLLRSRIQEFEDESIRRLLLRNNGTDVLPNGWQMGPENHGIQVVYGDVAGSSWRTMKTSGTLRVNAEFAAKVLISPELVPKFDEMTNSVEVVEELSPNSQVRLVCCKSVMFTSARDFCVFTVQRKEESGRILIATRSVLHPRGEKTGYTRAISFISGYIVTPDANDPNKCAFTLMAHFDLGGNVPATLLNYLGLSAPIKTVQKVDEVTYALYKETGGNL